MTTKITSVRVLWTFLILICCVHAVKAQDNRHQITCIIVPTKFEAFNAENKHYTSTFTKQTLSAAGYRVAYDTELPPDVAYNNCRGLTADLIDKSNMFNTKLHFEFKDCEGKVVYTTDQGTSKDKDYKRAFRQAILIAMNNIEGKIKVVGPYSRELAAGNKGGKPLANGRVINQNYSQEEQIYKAVTIDDKALFDAPVTNTPADISQSRSADVTRYKITKVEAPVATIPLLPQSVEVVKSGMGILYAQPIPSGYQLVDESPKVVMVIEKSLVPRINFAKKKSGEFIGLLYEENGKWLLEKWPTAEGKVEELIIKF